jgi:glycosyltransferase involved in cell wall biosynthesis
MSVACFATQGAGSLDERRILELLEPLAPRLIAFDRSKKAGALLDVWGELRRKRPDLVVMEGTGIAGGVAVLLADALLGIRYVVSSGDAVGPYLAKRHAALGVAGGIYERVLMRRAAGVIGWTPYLAGRALTFGAPRVVTAPGWARAAPAPNARAISRQRLGIPDDAVVFGLVGSLNWRASVGYVYGLELVRAIRRTDRADLRVCIVGDGPGRERLEREAGDDLGGRILLPGRVPPDEVADVLAAFDVASLPQTTDAVGSFRYTTKLPEYLAAGLPIVTGQIPAAYDLDGGWLWRLPGDAPWEEAYVAGLAQLMSELGSTELSERTRAAHERVPSFDPGVQQRNVASFIDDVLANTS